MKQIYFDQAATSFPKAPGVGQAMANYLTDNGANISRGTYQQAAQAGLAVLDTRERLARLFHFQQGAEQVIFTPGCTWGMNMLLKGFLKPGDHVIVSSLEHNAVMRPLMDLTKNGVTFSRIPASATGETKAADLVPLLKDRTRLVLVNHASNVSGTIFPLAEVAQICKARGIYLAVDGAQTAGHLDIDFTGLGLSALCVPGHKGLLGPQGIGALLLTKEFAAQIDSLISGGTGSASDQESQPDYLPDKFESGTLNIPGIFGLQAALTYIEQEGLAQIQERQRKLLTRFLALLEPLPIRIIGPKDSHRQVGVISLSFPQQDNGLAAFQLEQKFGILTRCGLHCAPNAHKVLHTFPQGTVRFSLGYFTTEEDIDWAAAALRSLCQKN